MRRISMLIFTVTLCFVLTASVPSSAWDGKKDNKSIAELQLMDEYELCNEMSAVCVTAGFYGNDQRNRSSLPGEGAEYMMTVRRVLRAKDIESPQWLSDYMSAIASHDAEKCSAVFVECLKAKVALGREQMDKEIEESRKANNKNKRTVPQK